MDVRVSDDRGADSPLRGGGPGARVLRDDGAAGLLAAAEETRAGPDSAREKGPGEAAVHGSQLREVCGP